MFTVQCAVKNLSDLVSGLLLCQLVIEVSKVLMAILNYYVGILSPPSTERRLDI